jgi:hypothetical protein
MSDKEDGKKLTEDEEKAGERMSDFSGLRIIKPKKNEAK